MSADGKTDPPPYSIPVETQEGGDIKIYHMHTPFSPPPTSTEELSPIEEQQVYTRGGGVVNSGLDSTDSKPKFVSHESVLGRDSGVTTCASCQHQVLTNVTYKAGTYAWLMCLLFICCGLFLCCCLIPLFMKNFKDVYHTCPRCNRVLHVEKKRCCS